MNFNGRSKRTRESSNPPCRTTPELSGKFLSSMATDVGPILESLSSKGGNKTEDSCGDHRQDTLRRRAAPSLDLYPSSAKGVGCQGKKMVAYRLVDLVGRASAANILGITVRELDKLVEVYKVSGRFTALRDPSAAITWARELMGVNKKLLVPTVVDAVVKKVNEKRITNSKDLRKLRTILPDPVARAHFLSDSGDLESAQLRIRPVEKRHSDQPLGELLAAVEAMKRVPWTTLQELKRGRNRAEKTRRSGKPVEVASKGAQRLTKP